MENIPKTTVYHKVKSTSLLLILTIIPLEKKQPLEKKSKNSKFLPHTLIDNQILSPEMQRALNASDSSLSNSTVVGNYGYYSSDLKSAPEDHKYKRKATFIVVILVTAKTFFLTTCQISF